MSYNSVVIGFSGGVDSTLISKAAYDILGDHSLAVIGCSPSYPRREEEQAIDLATYIGIPFITTDTHETSIDEYNQNRGDRCYYCKRELYSELHKVKEEYGFSEVLDGTNVSDFNDIRSGLKAVEELNVKKPLVEADLSKQEVRSIAKGLGLPNWNKPEFACLSSRFPEGTFITIDSLSRVEKGEQILYESGFRQFRLRYYDDLARIELLEEDFPKILDETIRKTIIKSLNQIGFRYITLDLCGYQKGNTASQARSFSLKSAK